MQIHNLQLRNFRNLEQVDTEFSPGINIIYGLNAQGKTNLLEAIYLLVTSRSFRTTSDSELIPWNASDYEGTLIRALVTKRVGQEQIALFLDGKVKRVLIDGKPITRLANLIGRLNAVLFTPTELLLVRGSPSLRRRFLDIAIGQTSSGYIESLQVYQQVLKNRNVLLKQAAHQQKSIDTQLDVYDHQLAQTGAVIIESRAAAIQSISDFASTHYNVIAENREPLSLEYEPAVTVKPADDRDTLQRSLHDTLLRARREDLRRQFTSRGPHRDDFQFVIQGHPARQFASQGQQRTAVLAAKLAEMDYLRTHTGEQPVLMLDDLMSELDEHRKRALLQHLQSDVQTFITTTDPESVTSYASAQSMLRVSAGSLTKMHP